MINQDFKDKVKELFKKVSLIEENIELLKYSTVREIYEEYKELTIEYKDIVPYGHHDVIDDIKNDLDKSIRSKKIKDEHIHLETAFNHLYSDINMLNTQFVRL